MGASESQRASSTPRLSAIVGEPGLGPWRWLRRAYDGLGLAVGLGGGTMDQENVLFEPCCPDCPLNERGP